MEETKQSSEVEEADLAQKALEATSPVEETHPEDTSLEDSPAGEPEQGVPIAKHAALRTRAQEAEVAAARAEGELAAIKASQERQTPESKSPLDLEIERQTAEGIAEDDMSISPKIIRAQEVYNQQVANQQAETTASQQLGQQQLASAKKSMIAHDDWQNVVKTGEAFLTPGELLDISRAGVDFGEVAYAKCSAVLAKNKSVPETIAAPKPSKSDTKVPTQSEILKGLSVDPAVEAAAQL